MPDPKTMIGAELAGRYRLTDHLQEGLQSDLWAAVRIEDGSPVSVKLIRPEYCTDPESVARYEREIRLLTAWRHPNLLRVVDSGRTLANVPWIAFEAKQGRLLSEDISDLALTPQNVAQIGEQLGRVLASAHRRGIVHRGLGPDAVMLTDDDGGYAVKVLDFGLAHLRPETGEARLTRVGSRLGQMEYLSPEYISDLVLDHRSDIYVLGLLVFEMLTGQPPFVGQTLRVAHKQVFEPAPAPSELSVHEIPPWLDQLVLDMLSKDPDERPADMTTVADAFGYMRWPPDSR